MRRAIGKEELRQYIEKIERLETEKTAVSDDIKEVYREAKNNGFDVKILRHVIRLKKLEPNKLTEQDALIDLYRAALEI